MNIGGGISVPSLFRPAVLGLTVPISGARSVRYVNLDNAATTPPFTVVEEAVAKFMEAYGSVHRGAGTKSQLSTSAYEASRGVIKDFVNAPKDSYVLFTGNTTGAMNAAAYFFSFLKGKVAVSELEHSSSWLPWIKAEGTRALSNRQFGLEEMDWINHLIQTLGRNQVVQYGVNDSFEFDLDTIEELFRQHTIKVFVLTASSNATGYCPDIKAIGEIVHAHGAYFVVDACQFVQHHPIDMQAMGIDFLAASGHKFYAPYGGGFLIGPQSFLDRFLSYEIGGGNLPYITASGEFMRYQNQLAHDPGTPNAVGAIAMAAALQELERIGLATIEAYETGLTRQAYAALVANQRVDLYVSERHLSTVLPFNIRGIEPRQVATMLNDRFGIGVRAGSFCVYNVVRRLLGITDDADIIARVEAGVPDAVPGFVRASFGLCNTQTDVERFIAAINQITAGIEET